MLEQFFAVVFKNGITRSPHAYSNLTGVVWHCSTYWIPLDRKHPLDTMLRCSDWHRFGLIIQFTCATTKAAMSNKAIL